MPKKKGGSKKGKKAAKDQAALAALALRREQEEAARREQEEAIKAREDRLCVSEAALQKRDDDVGAREAELSQKFEALDAEVVLRARSGVAAAALGERRALLEPRQVLHVHFNAVEALELGLVLRRYVEDRPVGIGDELHALERVADVGREATPQEDLDVGDGVDLEARGVEARHVVFGICE